MLVADIDALVEEVGVVQVEAVAAVVAVDEAAPEGLLVVVPAPPLVVVVLRAAAVDPRRPAAVDVGELVAVHRVAVAVEEDPHHLALPRPAEGAGVVRPGGRIVRGAAGVKVSRARRIHGGPDPDGQAERGDVGAAPVFHGDLRPLPERHGPVAVERARRVEAEHEGAEGLLPSLVALGEGVAAAAEEIPLGHRDGRRRLAVPRDRQERVEEGGARERVQRNLQGGDAAGLP